MAERLSDPARLEVLAALAVLDSGSDPDFDRLARLAGSIFAAPIAMVSLMDQQRQWFKASIGLEQGPTETGAEQSFCAHTIAARESDYLVIPDASRDRRFLESAFVAGPPHVRFYAGAPIVVRGQRIGSICVLAPDARADTDARLLEQLVDLAATAGSLFELKDEAKVRARTAAELIREEWRHALTLEAGKVGSWVWDFRTGEVTVNDILRRMYGLGTSGPVTASALMNRIDPDDREAISVALERAVRDGVDYEGEFRVVDSDRWYVVRGRVYQRDPSGKPLIIMGVNLEITESRKASEQTRTLLRELNHRVKNTLAMIQSLARQTLKRNPDPQAFIDAFSGRLRTLSDAHVLLSNRDWSGIRLSEIIAAQREGDFAFAPGQIKLSGEDIELSPDQALGLGLILHELTSNAARFGALSSSAGETQIAWDVRLVDEAKRLFLTWEESGGPPVTPPSETGLGVRLIERSLSKVLDSKVELDFPPSGVRARISFPLAEDAS